MRFPIFDSMTNKRLRATSICCLFAVLVAAWFIRSGPFAAAQAAGEDQAKFPVVDATSLNKDHLVLPENFGGEQNLVMISFAREQQLQVDTWLPAARKMEQQHPETRYYELPTTAKENLFYRWWFNSALRSNNTDPALEGRILTLYLSKGSFLRALHIPNEKQIAVLLVDRSGKVLWQTEGPMTPEKNQQLLSALTAQKK